MDIKDILSKVDHTLLRPDSTWGEIRALCDDAARYQTASVCIPPSFVRRASDLLAGRTPVCTVIGFPNGYATTSVKVYEAEDAIANGAAEIDMVVNLGAVKDGDDVFVTREIAAVKSVCGDRILKVIIETCLLTHDEIIRMCRAVTDAGADYIKTSTGFSSGGATFDDARLLRAHVGPGIKVKASGGIASLEDAREFIRLGCDRLGTSRVVKIVKELEMA